MTDEGDVRFFVCEVRSTQQMDYDCLPAIKQLTAPIVPSPSRSAAMRGGGSAGGCDGTDLSVGWQ